MASSQTPARRKHRMKSILVGASTLGFTLASAAAIFFALEVPKVQTELRVSEATVVELQETYEEQAALTEELQAQLAEQEVTLEEQAAVLESREGFIEAVEGAAFALDAAEGKVSTEELRKAVGETQEAVSKERQDPTVVTAATERVSEASQRLTEAVEEYDEALAAEEAAAAAAAARAVTSGGGSSSGGSSSSSGGASTGGAQPAAPSAGGARAALDSVGGSWVKLTVLPEVCWMPSAYACSHPDGSISIRADLAHNSSSWWYGIMFHEYAHQIQYQHWDGLNASPTGNALFGTGNAGIERMADCMVQSRYSGYSGPYQPYCSGEQLAFGAGVWSGVY